MTSIEIYRCLPLTDRKGYPPNSKNGQAYFVPGSYYDGRLIDKVPGWEKFFELVGAGPLCIEVTTLEELYEACKSLREWLSGSVAKQITWNRKPGKVYGWVTPKNPVPPGHSIDSNGGTTELIRFMGLVDETLSLSVRKIVVPRLVELVHFATTLSPRMTTALPIAANITSTNSFLTLNQLITFAESELKEESASQSSDETLKTTITTEEIQKLLLAQDLEYDIQTIRGWARQNPTYFVVVGKGKTKHFVRSGVCQFILETLKVIIK